MLIAGGSTAQVHRQDGIEYIHLTQCGASFITTVHVN